ncbi:MAG: hypothetical protein R3C56_39320 [Pirellulaceae bacterium]
MLICLELAGVTHPNQFEGREVIPLDGRAVGTLRRGRSGPTSDTCLAPGRARRRLEARLAKPAKLELFNIGRDRNESTNLSAENPIRVERMKQLHTKIFLQR